MSEFNIYATQETAWCPGCGDFGILNAVKKALEALCKAPHEVLMVGGIGQAAKLPQYISANGLCPETRFARGVAPSLLNLLKFTKGGHTP